MTIDKELVNYVAHLARIELNPQELEKLSNQLRVILDFINKLNTAKIEDIPTTSYVLDLSNVTRPDIPKVSLSAQEALDNTKFKEGNFFIVPKIIE